MRQVPDYLPSEGVAEEENKLKLIIVKPNGQTVEVNDVKCIYCEAGILELTTRNANKYAAPDSKTHWQVNDPNIQMERDIPQA